MTRVDISFMEFDQFVTLRYKTSKTNFNHTSVLIFIEVKHQQHHPVIAFCKLFFMDPEPADPPIFRQTIKVLSRKYLINMLKSRFVKYEMNATNYSGPSF